MPDVTRKNTATSVRRIAIVQSNYIPWKGYFDIIGTVDEFILLDNVSYTERDWRNRNLIKTNSGLRWLSVPVRHNRPSRISEVTVATDQGDWIRKHLGSISHSYADAPKAREVLKWLTSVYGAAGVASRLSDLNRLLLEEVCTYLGIKTRICWSTDYLTCEAMDEMERTQRLVELCKRSGADIYVSGPAAKAYMEVHRFEDEGIRVEWMDYEGYPPYPQLHGEFTHNVSIVDLLVMESSDAVKYMKFNSEPAEDDKHGGE